MKINSISPIVNNVAASQRKPVESVSQVTGDTSVSISYESPAEIESINNDSVDEEDEKILQKSIGQANKTLSVYDRKIERSVHEVTHAIMYTIKDTKTGQVISEFPPKKIQDMIAKMWELAGLFVDKKA